MRLLQILNVTSQHNQMIYGAILCSCENDLRPGIDTNVPMFRRVKGSGVRIEDTCSGCPADSEKRRVNQSTTIHNRLNSVEIVDKLT